MTALNWALQEEAVFLTADTLSLYEDGSPRSYMSKLYPVLHLAGVITGTGIGDFIVDWFREVQTQYVVRDLQHLDDFAPEALRELAEPYPHSEDLTSTIYHFGYMSQEARYGGYAYRSANNFESERLQYGYGIKPALEVEPPGHWEFPIWFVEVMERQREAELARPASQRVGVGGEIHALQMNEQGISIWTCHRFDGYESSFLEMSPQLP